MKVRYHFLAAGLAVVFVAAVAFKAGIYFETNDDRIITEILAGVIGGRPDAHTIWLFTIYLILSSVWEQAKNIKQFALSSVAVISCLLLMIYMVGQIQYTSTAAMLAVAGYVCLVGGQLPCSQ